MSDWSSDVCSSDLLSMLARIYDMRRMEVPPFVQEVLARAVPALLGLTHSDGGMGSWQGSGATSAAAIQAIVQASGVRTRPLKHARDWGYKRLVANKVVVLADAAPPPIARVTEIGRAHAGPPVTNARPVGRLPIEKTDIAEKHAN